MTVMLVAEERKVDQARVRFFQRVCSFPVMLAFSLIVLAVLTVRSRFDDPDMWWHLKTGEIIWTTHAIPTTDIFSYTTGHHAYVPHEWLSQVLIYGAYRLGGYTGLMLWLCFFASAFLVAGYGLCWLYSGNAKVGFLGAMVIWLFATIGLAIRPQMIGYLLLVFELLLIHLGRTRNPRWFLGLPPLFAVWVNCHGSFMLGLILAGIFLFSSFFDFRIGSLVSSRWELHCRGILALALVLSVAALFLNPIGVKQILYPPQHPAAPANWPELSAGVAIASVQWRTRSRLVRNSRVRFSPRDYAPIRFALARVVVVSPGRMAGLQS